MLHIHIYIDDNDNIIMSVYKMVIPKILYKNEASKLLYPFFRDCFFKLENIGRKE